MNYSDGSKVVRLFKRCEIFKANSVDRSKSEKVKVSRVLFVEMLQATSTELAIVTEFCYNRFSRAGKHKYLSSVFITINQQLNNIEYSVASTTNRNITIICTFMIPNCIAIFTLNATYP